MPYHYPRNETRNERRNDKKDIVKENKSLKQPAITGLSPKMSEKLREHSKMHKGGMASKHIKNMLKHLRAKKTFKQAHDLAVKADNEDKNKK